jgi:outer membrane phospholipase A
VISLVGGKGYTATSMMWPTFGEWVHFYGTAEAASAERVRLKSQTAPRWRVWRQLLRTQRSNTLVFAPAQKDWFSPIRRCLERARVPK